MRNALLTILILAFLPLAAADGPSASVDTLTSDGSCTSDGWSDGSSGGGSYDNGTRYYWYSYSQSEYSNACHASSSTLAAYAGDDAGPIAQARVYQENASSVSDHQNDWNSQSWGPDYSSYGGSRDSTWAFNGSEERGARVDALGAGAGQASGCASHAQYSDSSSWGSSWWNDPYYGTSSYSYGRSDSNSGHRAQSCADAANAGVGGHGANAARVDGCTNDDAHNAYSYSSSYSDSWWSESYANDAHANDCWYGAAADADGYALFAGRDDACSSASRSAERASGSSYGSSNDSSSFATSHCFHGYVVDGPDGMHFAAGNTTRSFESCYQGSCSGGSSETQAVSWSWGASPVQVLAQGEADTPVWVPILS